MASSTIVTAQDTLEIVTDRLSVTAVEIPVQIVRKGQPVSGLTAADFEVYDRGVREPIVDFDVLDLSDSASRTSSEDLRQEGRHREPRARHFVLLIDLAFTDWQRLPRAIGGAREMVHDQLHPTDRMAIGFVSPSSGVQLLHSLTTNRQASRLALDVLSEMVDRDPVGAGSAMSALAAETGLEVPGLGGSAEGWQRLVGRWIASAAQPIGASPLQADETRSAIDAVGSGRTRSIDDGDLYPVRGRMEVPDLYDEQTLRRLLFVGQALRDLTRSLAAIAEPKQLLLLSGGVPSRFLDSRDHSTRVLARLDLVIQACLESGWVVQTIDVRGVPSFDEAAFDGNALFHLARHTGGQFYENFNNVAKAAATILDRTKVTYILVIQPRVEANGSFHPLEVRLRQPRGGERLQYRPGYRAPTPGGRTANLDSRGDVARLILAESEIRDFDLDLLTVPVPAVAGRASVPVVVEIPGEALLENPFGDSVSIEFHAYALDSTGGVGDLFIKRVDVDLQRSASRLGRGGLRLLGHLDLGPGAGEVRVLVRNLANDAISMARQRIEVVSLAEQPLYVLPPLFVDRSRDWLSKRVEGGAPADGDSVALSGLITAEYFPKIKPALRPGRAHELMLNLFFSGPETPKLQIRVVTALGREVEGAKIRLVGRSSDAIGGFAVVATLQPKGLAPGGYKLEVALVDPASGERVASSYRFVVEGSS